MTTYVRGSGTYVPDRVVTNEELAPVLGVTSERIVANTGIRERRWAAPGQFTSAMAVAALNAALENAQMGPEDIDYLLVGTMTPDRFIPGIAPAVRHAAGLREIPSLDLRATCCNALYGMDLARALIGSGQARHVAICLAERQSDWLDLSAASASVSMLFGDGASALILSAEPGDDRLRVVDVVIGTDGSQPDSLGVRAPGDHPRMAGPAVIVNAVRRMSAAVRTLLERHALSVADVRWIVPHQANANLFDQLAKSLGVDRADERVVSVIAEFGNTSSASMGIALDRLRRSGKIQPGDRLVLPAFGAGFVWGAGLVESWSSGVLESWSK